MFWRSILPSSSGLKCKSSKKPALSKYNRCRQYVYPKCWLTITGLYGVIFKKIELLAATAVRTSNPIETSKFLITYKLWHIGITLLHTLIIAPSLR
jgi:hypothetical protein